MASKKDIAPARVGEVTINPQSDTASRSNDSDEMPALWCDPEMRPIVTSTHFSIAKVLYALEHEPRIAEVSEATAHHLADCLRNYLSDFFRELAFRQKHILERKKEMTAYAPLIQNCVRARHTHASYLNLKPRALLVVDRGHCSNDILGNFARRSSDGV